MKTASPKPISDEAVKKATGHNWNHWFALLDKKGAKKLTHKEIARMLYGEKLVKNQWWCQMVTVQYEYQNKMRTLGKTADVGFEVGVTKTVPASPKDIWKQVTSSKGTDIWLGKTTNLSLKPGTKYQTKDGTTGEIRTIKPGERLRLTYQPKGTKSPSTLQLTVTPRQTTRGTCIRFHQEKLTSEKERGEMRRHWQKVLEQLPRLSTLDSRP